MTATVGLGVKLAVGVDVGRVVAVGGGRAVAVRLGSKVAGREAVVVIVGRTALVASAVTRIPPGVVSGTLPAAGRQAARIITPMASKNSRGSWLVRKRIIC